MTLRPRTEHTLTESGLCFLLNSQPPRLPVAQPTGPPIQDLSLVPLRHCQQQGHKKPNTKEAPSQVTPEPKSIDLRGLDAPARFRRWHDGLKAGGAGGYSTYFK